MEDNRPRKASELLGHVGRHPARKLIERRSTLGHDDLVYQIKQMKRPQRINTQPCSTGNFISHRQPLLKRSSLADNAMVNTQSSVFDVVTMATLSPRIQKRSSKEYNLKNIHAYISQEFFQQCVRERPQSQLKQIRNQWRYLSKYGGEIQRMGMKTLTNFHKRKSKKLEKKDEFSLIDQQNSAKNA